MLRIKPKKIFSTLITNLKQYELFCNPTQLQEFSPTRRTHLKDFHFPKAFTFQQVYFTQATHKEPALAKRFHMCLNMEALFESSNLFKPKPPHS